MCSASRLPRFERAGAAFAFSGAVLLAGCSSSRHLGFLNPQGPVAAAQRGHLFEVVALVLIAVLPVLFLAPWIAWRYRLRKPGARKSSLPYQPSWTFSWLLEIAAWGGPILVVGALALLLVRNTLALDPYQPIVAPGMSAEASALATTRVQVIAYDWKWLFIYPDLGIATLNELAFPAGKPLALQMTSGSVMQSLQIPALGGQMYVMGGMVTRLNLLADAPGRFNGQNMLFNGRGFHEQKFAALAMAPQDFASWIERVRMHGKPLDLGAQKAISQRSTMGELLAALPDFAVQQTHDLPPESAAVVHFKDVPPDFFRTVMEATQHGITPVETVPTAHPAHGPAKAAQ